MTPTKEEAMKYLIDVYERMGEPAVSGMYFFPYEERFNMAVSFGGIGTRGVMAEDLDEKINTFVRENRKAFSKHGIIPNRKDNALPLYKDKSVTFLPPTELDKSRLREILGEHANI